MEKDRTIVELIERLKLLINFALIEIVDYWDADLCAIGLKKGDKVVYISTFNSIENEELNYDFDLEKIVEKDKEKIEVMRVGRNVSEAELVREINLFFELFISLFSFV